MRERGYGGGNARNDAPSTDDLDALAGTWSAEEAVEFERALAAQRAIDPHVWA